MKRFLATTGLLATGALAVAQPPAPKPGYLIIRVKLGDGGAPALGAPGQGGPGEQGAGMRGRMGMMQGGRGGIPGQGGPGGGLPGEGGPLGGGAGGGNANANTNERSIAVLVPYSRLSDQPIYKGKMASADRNPRMPHITHEFGVSVLYHDGTNVQVKADDHPPIDANIKAEYKKWVVQPDRKPDTLVRLIDEALKADLVDLAYEYTESLERLVAERKGAEPNIEAFVKAYAELKTKLNDPLKSDAVVEQWKSKMGGTAVVAEDAAHFSVIHFGDQNLSAESLARKVKLLEKNYKAFYLWHALKLRRALPLPESKLIVVVARRGGEMNDLRDRVDGLPLIGDSFFSQQHNILVLSPERMDDLGRSFFEAARSKYAQEGFNRNELLKGNHPAVKEPLTPTDVALASTYALVDKMLEVETDAAIISSEGTRQLFAASGLLPKHVLLPQWMEHGLASVLQHPKSVGVVELGVNKPGLALGLFNGYGAPNSLLQREFKLFYPMKKNARDNENPLEVGKAEEILKNTLTDKYFEAARAGIDLDASAAPAPAGGAPGGRPGGPGRMQPGGVPGGGAPGGTGGVGGDAQGPGGRRGMQQPPGGQGGPGGPPTGFGGPGGQGFPGQGGGEFGGSGILDPNAERPPLNPERLRTKADATAWALTYYLTQKHTTKQTAFYASLNAMPRDMKLSSTLVLTTFCQEFGLMNDDQVTVNEAAFKTFAEDWVKYVNGLQPTWREITLAAINPANPGGGTQGGPGGAGAGTGAPGGGGNIK
jgi:hypothetical protein